MSSFMKQGKRKSVHSLNKKRVEAVMDILQTLDDIAIDLIKYSAKHKRPLKREEIKELASEYTDIEIGNLEESILWNKIMDFDKRLENHRIENESNT